MLDEAEEVFRRLADALISQNTTVAQEFDSEEMLHVLDHFEGDTQVKVMTADDFITRCY